MGAVDTASLLDPRGWCRRAGNVRADSLHREVLVMEWPVYTTSK